MLVRQRVKKATLARASLSDTIPVQTPTLPMEHTMPAVSPIRPTMPCACLCEHHSTDPHGHRFAPKLKDKVERLTSRLRVVLHQGKVRRQLGTAALKNKIKCLSSQFGRITDIHALRQENKQLRLLEQMLEGQLERKDAECREAEKIIDLIKEDLSEQQVASKEVQESAIDIEIEAEELRGTVEKQAAQITSLLELVDNMKTTIEKLKAHPTQRASGSRPYRNVIRQSEPENFNAIAQNQDLPQMILDQQQEIAELHKRLDDHKSTPPPSQITKDMQDLRTEHEILKAQMENVQYLLKQHSMASTAQTGHDDTKIRKLDDSVLKRQKNKLRQKPCLTLHDLNDLNKSLDCTDFTPPPSAHPSLPRYTLRDNTSNMTLGSSHSQIIPEVPKLPSFSQPSHYSRPTEQASDLYKAAIHPHGLEQKLPPISSLSRSSSCTEKSLHANLQLVPGITRMLDSLHPRRCR